MAEQTSEDAVSDDVWAQALAEQGDAATGTEAVVSAAQPKVFQHLAPGVQSDTRHDLDLILDIPILLTVELGRTKVAIKDLLQLAQGSVVELDGLAGEPMNVFVNGCLIAQGEVVVVNDKFGIRLTDIVTPSERIRKLNR